MSKATPIKFTGDGITGPKIFKNKYLNLDGKAGLVFDGLTFTSCGQIRGENAHHITFVNCQFIDMLRDNEKQVQLLPGNDHWIFDGCIFSHCGDAIYANQVDGIGGESLIVEDCHFRYIGTNPEHKSKDGHCVGWQCWKHVLIKGCMTYDTGSAFSGWAPKNAPLTDATIEDNDIYAVRKMPWMQTNGNAIEFSGSHPLGKRYNLLVWRNKVYDAAGYGLSSNSDATIWGLASNQFHDCKQGKTRINGVVEK